MPRPSCARAASETGDTHAIQRRGCIAVKRNKDMDPKELVLRVVLPAGVVSLGVLTVAWYIAGHGKDRGKAAGSTPSAPAAKTGGRSGRAWWLSALVAAAAGAGYASGYPFVTNDSIKLQPDTAIGWTFAIAIAAAFLSAALEGKNSTLFRWIFRPLVLLVAMTGVAYLTGRPAITSAFSDDTHQWLAFAGIGAAGAAVWISLSAWLNSDRGWMSPLGIWIWAVACAGALLPSGQSKAALLFGVLAALAGSLLVIRLLPPLLETRSYAGPIAAVATVLFIVSFVAGRRDAYMPAAPLLVLAPIVAGSISSFLQFCSGSQAWLGRRSKWQRGLAAVAAAAILAGTAAGLSKLHFDKLDSGGYGLLETPTTPTAIAGILN